MTIINTPYEIDKRLTWQEMKAQESEFEQTGKIAITGSRHYPDYTRVDHFLKRVKGTPIIVSDFGGVEQYVKELVSNRGDILMYYPRDYANLGAQAESIAQANVIKHCTWLVVFFDNDEPYCQQYINQAIEHGKRVYILPSLKSADDYSTIELAINNRG